MASVVQILYAGSPQLDEFATPVGGQLGDGAIVGDPINGSRQLVRLVLCWNGSQKPSQVSLPAIGSHRHLESLFRWPWKLNVEWNEKLRIELTIVSMIPWC